MPWFGRSCKRGDLYGGMQPGAHAWGLHLNAQRFEVHGVLHIANATRGCQQSLGRHTSPIDAGAPDVMPLNDGCAKALQVHLLIRHRRPGTPALTAKSKRRAASVSDAANTAILKLKERIVLREF